MGIPTAQRLSGAGLHYKRKTPCRKKQHVEYLKTGIRILSRAITQQANTEDSQLLQIFANGLALLDDYDHEKLDASGRTNRQTVYPDVQDYLKVIAK